MIRTKAESLNDKALPDDDNEGDTEGETSQSLASASFATSESPPRGRGFTASKDWFDKFQKRYGIRSVPLYGEAASADTDAACRYVENEFPMIINGVATYLSKCLTRMKQVFFGRGCLLVFSSSRMK